ncbi:unnamed protein product [Phaeothamnion confervicola]
MAPRICHPVVPVHGYAPALPRGGNWKWGSSRLRTSSFVSTETLHRWTKIEVNTKKESPTARSGHNVVLAGRKAYVFGGCANAALNDLHTLDMETLKWTEVTPAGGDGAVVPSVRTCAAMCANDDGTALYLCGGAGDDPDDLRNDMYEFDTRRSSWKLLYPAAPEICGAGVDGGGNVGAHGGGAGPGGDDAGQAACARIGHSICYHATSGRLIVFGGSTGYEYFNDCFAFSLAEGRWFRLATAGDVPSPRYKHRAVIHGDALFVVGGGAFEPSEAKLEVFKLDLVMLRWSHVACGGAIPKGRAAHSLAFDKESAACYVWGGFTAGMELSQRLYKLDLRTARWEEVVCDASCGVTPGGSGTGGDGSLSPTESSGGSRGSHGFGFGFGRRARAAAAATEGGGRGGGGGAALQTSERPPARSFHGAVFYKGSHVVVGGSNGVHKMSDVWRYAVAETPPSLAALAGRAVVSAAEVGEIDLMWLPPEVQAGLNNINMLADKIF